MDDSGGADLAGARQSPSRSWFAANRVDGRVTTLETQMNLVHTYCFATAPRDIQNLNMSFDNLGSRQNGLEKSVENDLKMLNTRITSLTEQQDEHANALMRLGQLPVPMPAPSAPPASQADMNPTAPLQSEAPSGGDPLHSQPARCP